MYKPLQKRQLAVFLILIYVADTAHIDISYVSVIYYLFNYAVSNLDSYARC